MKHLHWSHIGRVIVRSLATASTGPKKTTFETAIMPRSIENPFKERRIHWVQTVAAGVSCLSLFFLLFGSPLGGAPPRGSGDDARLVVPLPQDASKPGVLPHSIQSLQDGHRSNLRNLALSGQRPNMRGGSEASLAAAAAAAAAATDDGPDGDDNTAQEGAATDDVADIGNEKNMRESSLQREQGGGLDGDTKDGSNGDDEGGTDGGNQNDGVGEKEVDKDDDEEAIYAEEFPMLNQEQYDTWLKRYYKELDWETHPPQAKLTRKLLQESLVLGCDNIAANQKEAGNFNYQYDFVKKKLDTDDSPVRQAGALWGMTLCFQHFPNNNKYQKAVERGIHFFHARTVKGPASGSVMIHYPDASESETGVNALFGLAIVDYLRTLQDNVDTVMYDFAKIEEMNTLLTSVLQFLKYMQNDDLHFSQAYHFNGERKLERSSPYYDGEAMLCLCKAARHLDGFFTLIPRIVETAPVLAKEYTLDKWRYEHDSDQTKGFYQWSSMFLTEYYQAQWTDYELYGDYVIVLAHWVIHTHEILDRNRNTGYAFEGIISAYQIAQDRGDKAALEDFAYTIDEGIHNLCTWQVGGPLAGNNPFLVKHPTEETVAVGGIMNAVDLAPLRIDTTQHQMHALMMALTTVYKE